MANNEIKKIEKILRDLSTLKQFKEVKALKKRLTQDLEKFSKKEKLIPQEQEIKIPKQESTNQKRSSKLSRYWRYVKLIRDRFPNLTTSEIRKQLKTRQQGQKTEIPDAIWQNPSA
jgi:hypothetical protein